MQQDPEYSRHLKLYCRETILEDFIEVYYL